MANENDAGAGAHSTGGANSGGGVQGAMMRHTRAVGYAALDGGLVCVKCGAHGVHVGADFADGGRMAKRESGGCSGGGYHSWI